MVVTGVMSAGSEGYGEEDISEADPLPMLKSDVKRAKDFLEKNKVEPVTDDLFGF